MKIDVTQVEVISYRPGFLISINEEEALILLKIIGNVGGNHPWRDKFLNPFYNILYDKIGHKKVDDFIDENDKVIEISMYLKNNL